MRDNYRSSRNGEKKLATIAIQDLKRHIQVERAMRKKGAVILIRAVVGWWEHILAIRGARYAIQEWIPRAISNWSVGKKMKNAAEAETPKNPPWDLKDSVPPCVSPPGKRPKKKMTSPPRHHLKQSSYFPRRSDGSGHVRPGTEPSKTIANQGPLTHAIQKERHRNDTTFPTDPVTRQAIKHKLASSLKKAAAPVVSPYSVLNPPANWDLLNQKPVIKVLRGPEKRLNEIAMRTLGTPVRYPNRIAYLGQYNESESDGFEDA